MTDATTIAVLDAQQAVLDEALSLLGRTSAVLDELASGEHDAATAAETAADVQRFLGLALAAAASAAGIRLLLTAPASPGIH